MQQNGPADKRPVRRHPLFPNQHFLTVATEKDEREGCIQKPGFKRSPQKPAAPLSAVYVETRSFVLLWACLQTPWSRFYWLVKFISEWFSAAAKSQLQLLSYFCWTGLLHSSSQSLNLIEIWEALCLCEPCRCTGVLLPQWNRHSSIKQNYLFAILKKWVCERQQATTSQVNRACLLMYTVLVVCFRVFSLSLSVDDLADLLCFPIGSVSSHTVKCGSGSEKVNTGRSSWRRSFWRSK